MLLLLKRPPPLLLYAIDPPHVVASASNEPGSSPASPSWSCPVKLRDGDAAHRREGAAAAVPGATPPKALLSRGAASGGEGGAGADSAATGGCSASAEGQPFGDSAALALGLLLRGPELERLAVPDPNIPRQLSRGTEDADCSCWESREWRLFWPAGDLPAVKLALERSADSIALIGTDSVTRALSGQSAPAFAEQGHVA